MKHGAISAVAWVCLVMPASAAYVVTTTQGEESNLQHTFSGADLLNGKLPTSFFPGLLFGQEQAWHPVNTDPLDRFPAFTDGIGMRASGLTGLLRDFPASAPPALRSPYSVQVVYTLDTPQDLGELRIFSGNNGRDGRVFHTYVVEFSTDGTFPSNTLSDDVYVQSHQSGTLNNASMLPQPGYTDWRCVETSLTHTSGVLASATKAVRISIFPVDNTGGQMRDPYDGVNQYTGVDDQLTAAFVSPLIWEIDLFKASPVKTVTGKVVLSDFVGDITQVPMLFEIRQGGNTEIKTVFLSADGGYSLTTGFSGSVAVSLKPSHWLRKTNSGIDLGAGGASNVDFVLINGDIDNDNMVTVFDYGALSDSFDSSPGSANWNPEADLDGDDAVTVFDYGILSDQFDKPGED